MDRVIDFPPRHRAATAWDLLTQEAGDEPIEAVAVAVGSGRLMQGDGRPLSPKSAEKLLRAFGYYRHGLEVDPSGMEWSGRAAWGPEVSWQAWTPTRVLFPVVQEGFGIVRAVQRDPHAGAAAA